MERLCKPVAHMWHTVNLCQLCMVVSLTPDRRGGSQPASRRGGGLQDPVPLAVIMLIKAAHWNYPPAACFVCGGSRQPGAREGGGGGGAGWGGLTQRPARSCVSYLDFL